MIKLALCSAVLLVAVAAGAADKGKSASATFKDANGKSVGTATFTEKEGGVEISKCPACRRESMEFTCTRKGYVSRRDSKAQVTTSTPFTSVTALQIHKVSMPVTCPTWW